MTRAEVREFIENGVNALSPSVEFNEGLFSDWNADRSKQYPAILSLLEETDTDIPDSNTTPLDTWPVKLIIARLDKMDSLASQYEPLVDQCDYVAQQLVYKYRAIISGYKLISIEKIHRLKFVKSSKHGADCTTGIELTFDLINQDQTDVCG